MNEGQCEAWWVACQESWPKITVQLERGERRNVCDKDITETSCIQSLCPYVAITHAGIPTTALQLAHTYLGSYPYTT